MPTNKETSLLYVRIIKKTEKDFVIPYISIDKELWYLLPEDSRDLQFHPKLSSKKPIQNCISAIKNLNGYRTIAIRIDNDIILEYFDEEGNVCFNQLPLEEYVPSVGSQPGSSVQLELEDRIKRLECQLQSDFSKEEIKLHNIEKKFILDNFEKKQHDPIKWLRHFEDECNRFQITRNSLKIQALRFFVSGSSKDWYETNLTKIGLNAPWDLWKTSFCNVFVDKGWSIVREAFSFRYLGGSLIDYALSKVKLCLEAESKCTELSLINQVVFGLPSEAQEELDREDITNLDVMYAELRKLEDLFSRKRKEKPLSPKLLNKQNFSQSIKKNEPLKKIEPQQCPICESQGFPNRFHLPADCRFKNWRGERPKSNGPSHSTNLTDVEILNVDLGKQDLN
ncbi:hypothetical protein RI129_002996 [Pyrocoelia pectoralis]|uniref:Uncharacterized protein n=1 Tax=Pyrocoelia pectoralis TaxID=417401 RepID=A0AAN7VPV9_9COLE